MTAASVRRCSGLLGIVVLWLTIGAGVRRAELDLLGPRPLSDLGSTPPSAVLFRVGLAAGAVLFVAFLGDVRSRFSTTRAFSTWMLVGMGCQFVAAVVPIGGDGLVNRVHVTSALILGGSIPVFMSLFALAQRAGAWRRRCALLAMADLVACAVGFALSKRHLAPVAEVVPAIVFHLWITVLTVTDAPTASRR